MFVIFGTGYLSIVAAVNGRNLLRQKNDALVIGPPLFIRRAALLFFFFFFFIHSTRTKCDFMGPSAVHGAVSRLSRPHVSVPTRSINADRSRPHAISSRVHFFYPTVSHRYLITIFFFFFIYSYRTNRMEINQLIIVRTEFCLFFFHFVRIGVSYDNELYNSILLLLLYRDQGDTFCGSVWRKRINDKRVYNAATGQLFTAMDTIM